MSGAQGDLERFRSDSPEPLSFRERGAVVPFTTPLLLNARIRDAEIGPSREMVVLNLSGGRGALVLPWTAMPEICSPTLYDRHLWESLSGAEDISPIGIRREAQRLAAQGLAGRHAATAAREAQTRDEAAQRLMRSALLAGLIAATETAEEKASAARQGHHVPPDGREEKALIRAAAIAQVPLDEFALDLEALATALSGAPPETSGHPSRLRNMLGGLGSMAGILEAWSKQEGTAWPQKMAAQSIYLSARQTMDCTEKALIAASKILLDFGSLVPRWKAEKEKTLENARTPDWVMDGWSTPLAIWDTSGPEERRAAIWDLAQITPMLPREAKALLGKVNDWRETPKRLTHTVQEAKDWRSGAPIEVVTRNSSVIAPPVSFENQMLPMRLNGRVSASSLFKDRTKTRKDREAANAKQESLHPEHVGSMVGIAQQGGAHGVLKALGDIGEVLANAPDSKLLKIVSLVDRLANGEIHQRLLGPSLPRLKLLRPPRSANLKRILLLPLSGALTNSPDWRESGAQITRSAISPMMEVLCPALGEEAVAIREALRELKQPEADIVDQFGQKLWLLAAQASRGLPSPSASLSQAGLTEADFQSCLHLAEGLWRHAGPLWEGMKRMRQGCAPDELRAALIGPAEESRHLFAAALASLMLRTPDPVIFVSLLKDDPIHNAAVVEQMLLGWMSQSWLDLPQAEFVTGARLAEQTLMLLEELETVPRRHYSLASTELAAQRRDLDKFCRRTYREIVSVHITQSLLNIPQDEPEQFREIEAMAHVARDLENTGQRVAASQSYNIIRDEFRTRMGKALRSASPSALSDTDVARIEEILMAEPIAKTAENLVGATAGGRPGA